MIEYTQDNTAFGEWMILLQNHIKLVYSSKPVNVDNAVDAIDNNSYFHYYNEGLTPQEAWEKDNSF